MTPRSERFELRAFCQGRCPDRRTQGRRHPAGYYICSHSCTPASWACWEFGTSTTTQACTSWMATGCSAGAEAERRLAAPAGCCLDRAISRGFLERRKVDACVQQVQEQVPALPWRATMYSLCRGGLVVVHAHLMHAPRATPSLRLVWHKASR